MWHIALAKHFALPKRQQPVSKETTRFIVGFVVGLQYLCRLVTLGLPTGFSYNMILWFKFVAVIITIVLV